MAQSADPTLGNRIEPEAPALLSNPPKSYTYYHAGSLFSLGDLQANVQLSSMVCKLSEGRYQPILPQDLEQRDTTPHAIRDGDIKALLNCDMALFTYDGSELDSGTVVEYMVAKFADLPSVILRTDFRGAGDQGAHKGDPWNLMSSFWPRTVGVVVDAMLEYKTGLGEASTSHGRNTSGVIATSNQHAGDRLLQVTAKKVVEAFDEVLQKPANLPKELRENVFEWLALMPGFKSADDHMNTREMLQLMNSKVEKGLL